MKTLIEIIRTCVEKHSEFKQMASELSELDPRELEAIVGIAPRDIDRYCRTVVDRSHRSDATESFETKIPKKASLCPLRRLTSAGPAELV